MLDPMCRNVLVRGVNWIGDAVMTMPALKALRKGLPGSRISLLVKPWVSTLFERDPNIKEIIQYGNQFKGLWGKVKLSRILNKKAFCSAILFQNAFDAAFITFLAGIRKRAGYNRDGRGFLLTDAVPVPENEKSIHHIQYYLNLLKKLGLKAEYTDPYIYLALHERISARTTLKDMNRPVLGINPGATYGAAKRWFPERFAEVADWFIKDTGGSVVIFGGESEVNIADEIYKKVNPEYRTPNSLQSLAGKTSLREFIALVSECDGFVTNDSGPLHIAYAVGTPLVAIFGSTDPQLTGPPPGMYGQSTVVVKPDISCSPCFERICKQNDMRCMYEITSDDVYYGIREILPNRHAVFFDRDGTLCRDTGYLNKYDDLQIFSDVDDVKLLKENGFAVIGITNQSGIARGMVEEDFVKEVNTLFMKKYSFDDFYYCPHHPDEYCSCRKPEPGMVFKARAQHRIDLKKSYVIGDKEADMLLAKAIGAKGILVQTGEAKDSQHADYVTKDLKEAINVIIIDSRK